MSPPVDLIVAHQADSDITISLLCEGEDNHAAVERIVNAWRLVGGDLLIAVPVLEEVAHHAWIAESEYSYMRKIIGSLSAQEARFLINNAFLRSFKTVSNTHSLRDWGYYIGQFRGLRRKDYANVLEFLRSEYNFKVLPPAGSEENSLAIDLEVFLVRKKCEQRSCSIEQLDFRIKDKCRRDAKLLCSVNAARKAARSAGLKPSVIVLSSARNLQALDREFRSTLVQRPASTFLPETL